MTDEQLPFQLDIVEYDWLILGTGFEETLYSAHLSKVVGDQVNFNQINRISFLTLEIPIQAIREQ